MVSRKKPDKYKAKLHPVYPKKAVDPSLGMGPGKWGGLRRIYTQGDKRMDYQPAAKGSAHSLCEL